MAFMPHNAGLVVLAFLGTCFLLGVAGLLFLWLLAAREYRGARLVFLAAVAVGAAYGGTLLGVSLASEEKTLAPGDLKYFCEVDCHVAYSVSEVATAKTLGEGPRQVTAAGTFYVVTLRTWFDEDTISRRRPKELPLWPNPRIVRAVDSRGRTFRTSLAGQKAVVGSTVPLTHDLKPGESYETQLVFDLPVDGENPRLLLGDWFPLARFLIGHENSFLHKKIYFDLRPRGHLTHSREL